MTIEDLLDFALKNKASDLHLSAGQQPIFRIDGVLNRFDHPIVPAKKAAEMIDSVMNPIQRKNYQTQLETDFSFTHTHARFRVNAFIQEYGPAAVFRLIPSEVLTLTDLDLPKILAKIASFTQGLVLVTGPTGSGKTTTLAAMIEYINTTRQQHILTIEDPIEFLHHSKKMFDQST